MNWRSRPGSLARTFRSGEAPKGVAVGAAALVSACWPFAGLRPAGDSALESFATMVTAASSCGVMNWGRWPASRCRAICCLVGLLGAGGARRPPPCLVVLLAAGAAALPPLPVASVPRTSTTAASAPILDRRCMPHLRRKLDQLRADRDIVDTLRKSVI